MSRKISIFHEVGSSSPSPPQELSNDHDPDIIIKKIAQNINGQVVNIAGWFGSYNKLGSFQASSLGHEISAPYEVPQFPIEQLESKLLDLRKSSICPSANLNNQVGDDSDFSAEDFVPHFQRVNISGEDITGEPSPPLHCSSPPVNLCPGYSAEELQSKSKLLHEAIELRRRYMKYSRQNFSADCEHFLKRSSTDLSGVRRGGEGSHVSLLDHQVHAPKSSGDHWECDLQPDLGYVCQIEQGVFRVYRNKDDLLRRKNINIDYPTLDIFVRDLQVRDFPLTRETLRH